MESRHQRREVRIEEDDLAVEHEALLPQRPQRLDELREVPGERAVVPAPKIDVVARAEGEAAEPVPLRLVDVPARRKLV